MRKIMVVLFLPLLLLAQGKIGISSDVKNAYIYVDGKQRAMLTQDYVELDVRSGKRVIKLERLNSDGSKNFSQEQTIDVKKGALVKIHIATKKVVTKKVIQKPVIEKQSISPFNNRDDDFSNSSENVVYDKKLKLFWQDDSRVGHIKKSWQGAKSYCATLNVDGLSGWRLPTIKELFTIMDMSKHDPSIKSIFKNIANDTYNYYWTSTLYADQDLVAWVIRFSRGNSDRYGKSSLNYVRCVR